MTQQSQAKSLHEKGVQGFEEIRRDMLQLQSKQEAGEITPEAYKAERKRLYDKTVETDAMIEDAALLTKCDGQIEELNSQVVRNRPVGDPGNQDEGDTDPQPAGPTQLSARTSYGGDGTVVVGGMPLSPEQLQRVAKIAGVQPRQFNILSGKGRALVNAVLRNGALNKLQSHLPARSLNADEIQFLQAPRQFEELNVNPYIDRDGGAVVASEVRNEIIGQLRDRRHIRTKARVISTNAASVSFPTFQANISLKKTRAHQGKVDGSGPQSVRDILGKTEFTPSGRMETIQVPEELIEDTSFDIVGFLSEEIGMQAFDDEEGDFLTGSGSSEPYGVLTALEGTSQIFNTGGSGAAIEPEDLKRIPYKIREVFRGFGAWMGFREFYETCSLMRDDSGAAAGTGDFLFQKGIAPGDPSTLAGYEALESEFFPNNWSSGSAGDPLALFGDWRQFWIVDRVTMEIRVLPELFAQEMQVGFRYRKRYDAAPVRLESWAVLGRS